MVKIRLTRLGRKKRPFYRMVVINDQARRDGAPLAEIGYYDPIRKQLKLNKELAASWIAKGAQMSATAKRLLDLAPESGELIELPKKELKQLVAASVAAAPEKEEKAEKAEKVEKAEVAE